MTRLVKIELLKLRTTPAAWVSAAVIVGLVLLSGVTTILLPTRGTAPLGSPSNVSHALAVGAATCVAMLILGITISAGEDRHRTALSTYLAEPRRGRVLAAKVGTGALVGAALGAGAYLVDVAVVVPLYAAKGVHHLPVHLLSLGAATVLVTACFGMLGVALGALTRNTVVAIVGALVWVGVIELGLLVPSFPSIGKWLPAAASKVLTSADQSDVRGLLSPTQAVTVLVAWAAALSVAARLVTLRREAR